MHRRTELALGGPPRRFGEVCAVSQPVPINEVELVDHLVDITARNAECARDSVLSRLSVITVSTDPDRLRPGYGL